MSKSKTVHPWFPVDAEDYTTSAIKALNAGLASSDQQKEALRWIIEDLARTYDLSYRPGTDGDRDTAFAEGKRFVGMQIVKQINRRQVAK